MQSKLTPKRTAVLLAIGFVMWLSQAASARDIQFSGYTWEVKESPETVIGPGPNWFASNDKSVFVDKDGALHLTVSRQNGVWTSSEVILKQQLGYGKYTFELGSDVSNLDTSLVLGFFTWSELPAQQHRELDVEFSRWSQPQDPTNAQFVVQPYDVADNRQRWTLPAAATSVHTMKWAKGTASFESFADGKPVASWSQNSSDKIPQPGDSRIHLNLWQFRGQAPALGVGAEIVIKKFSFSPSDS